MFKRQLFHYLALALLLGGVFALSGGKMLSGRFLSVPTHIWLLIAIATPIVHQFYVWACWRAELYHKTISRTFGQTTGFCFYAVGFAILFGLRLLTIIALAASNLGTLPIDPFLGVAIVIVLAVPSLYLVYSVLRYFGLKRAFGIDHFDAAYRKVPFVKKGIFRFSNNAMYVYGFLILWIPGFLGLSVAALLVAAFSHTYIWVHYYCTKLPDIRVVYGNKQ
ncbi:MAG: phosphatidylethanolamine N-methyltransferase family protein [Puniceicoccales bacterium]|nr:phosphatidylethanolamine N-methyltransferase family protein [Puniceicoccales bacterium]